MLEAGYATRTLDEWVHFVGKLTAAPLHSTWEKTGLRGLAAHGTRRGNLFVGHQKVASYKNE